ncbi:MAG: preprotein translocase subunit YajC [Aeoliella sp.]
MDWFDSLDGFTPLILLAQEEAQAQNVDRPWWFSMIPMALIFLAAYFMLILPERKKQERLQKLQTVKEKDHVITTGGIYGVVTNVQRDAGRVTLRVDETTGAKIKISLTAVAQILGDDDSGTSAPSNSTGAKDKS